MKRTTCEYKHIGPIVNWHEGLMLGNGHLGALIYGEKKLTISLDMIDLWDNRLTSEMKEKGFNYSNMIKTLKNDWDEYLRLFDNCYNHPYPTKLNAGSIIFDTEIGSSSLFKVDIKKAEFNMDDYQGYIDANKDVMVIHLPNKVGFHFHMPEYLYKKEQDNGLEYPHYIEKEDGKYRYIIQETKCNYCLAIITLKIDDVLLITVIKSEDIKAAVEKAKNELQQYAQNIEVQHKLHLKYWKSFYKHSSVETGVAKIDRLYNFGRYFLACNSKNSYPMSLEGVWTRNDGNLPPWKGDYHLDINLQMSYESYMKTGDFKEGKALVDYLWNSRNAFKRLAKKFCHSEGYYIPGVMTQDCSPLGGWPMYALNPSNSIWICTAFDNYYRYRGNKAFLKNRAFPFLSNIEKCISSLLVMNENGFLQFEFSASPEINDCEKEAILKHQSNFELSMLYYLYETLIEYSQKLGYEDAYFVNQLKQLSPFYKDNNGEMMISQDLKYDVSHRHFSHILCHKNLELFNPYNDYEQILKDFNNLEKQGHDWWAGFSFTEASSLASYIGLGEKAYELAYIFADGFVNDNCFHMNMDLKDKGYSKIKSYAFTLEANMGFVRAITDMMLRTTKGIITIFPAIPEDFKQKGVIFKNLRSFNNHKISASFKHDELSFNIKLSKPEVIRLYNNIGQSFVLEIDGERKDYSSRLGDIIDIPANKIIRLVK